MSVETLPLTGTRPLVLPRVNLLPPEIGEQRRLRQAQLGALAAVAAAAAVVGALFVSAHAGVASAKSDLASAQQRNTGLKAQIRQYDAVPATQAQLAAREAMLTAAMGTEVQWSHYLNDLALTMPANVWLGTMSMTQAEGAGAPAASTAAPATKGKPAAAPTSGGVFDTGIGKVTYGGVALKHDDVAAWLETLAKEKGYENPYFSSSTETALYGQLVVNFSSTVTLTPDAYSGRYSKPGGR